MPESLAGIKPGDPLVMCGYRSRRDVTVSRVGYKYLYVAVYGREYGFDLTDGNAKNVNDNDYVRTPEQIAEFDRRAAYLDEIRKAGFVTSGWSSNVTTKQLERVANALREPE